MEQISTVKALIDLWPLRREAAQDFGVDTDRVNGWVKAGSIPARYHRRVCIAAERRGFPITADLIDRLHCDCEGRDAA